jgi:gamma-glutamylcyclotransferase (GGCT)/AIG2-like uncharacterized protein YtfP
MNTVLFFAYGTLKQGHSRNRYLLEQRYLGTACTKLKYSIYHYSGYPAMVETKNNPVAEENVYGEIYEVHYDCLQQLDEIEKVNEGLFQRSQIDLDAINLVYLPLTQSVWTDIQSKKATSYIFSKELGGAKNCGSLWTQY